ncbi:hypothetical protein ACFL07_03745 [Pseudomonadota bacterium]
MKKRPAIFLLSLLAAMFLLLPAASMAQDSPPPLAEMWLVTPKAGHGSEFNEALTKHMNFRSENGDPRNWEAYTPLLGEKLNQVAIRFCCFNWADVDAYRAWSQSNKKIGEHFEKHVAPHAEHWAHYFETMDWDDSHWADSAGDATLFAITEFHIKPGHDADFKAARNQLLQIALNQGWASDDRSWLWSTTIGGSPRESIIIPHQNFASMDREEDSFSRFLSEKMGEEAAAALLRKFTGSTSGSTFQIWEHQKEMSMESGD